MRRMMTAVFGLVAMAGAAMAQQPATSSLGSSSGTTAAKKSYLEETLETAAKSNPDLRVALAKLVEAEAEVARTRLQVVQKVVSAYQEVEKARDPVTTTEAQLSLVMQRSARGEKDPQVKKLMEELAQLKARLAKAQADLDYLTGKPATRANPQLSFTQPYLNADPNRAVLSQYLLATVRDPARPTLSLDTTFYGHAVAGPTADRLRKALDQKVSLKFQDTSARSVLETLRQQASGLHLQASTKSEVWNEKVTAHLSSVPFGAALQLLEDVLTGYRIVVREYGLFIVPQEKVPPGAMLLGDFWRDAVKADKPTTTTPGVTKPANPR